MRLLFSSILLLLLSLSSYGQIDDCGKSTPIKENFIWHKAKRAIFGGNKVPVGKWPWQVLIIFVHKNDPTSSMSCGGSIIADRWILTAAHCFGGQVPAYLIYGSVVDKVGKSNIAYPNNSIIHENYNMFDYERNLFSPNDIALIELNQTITFDHAASAVCLPSKETAILPDFQVMATGFGTTNDRSNLSIVPSSKSSELLETIFPLFPHEVCKQRMPLGLKNRDVAETQICAGSYGHGTGKGDSGGPLVLYSEGGRWFQIGISSFGENDDDRMLAQDIYPDFYTKVNQYCDWIEENTRGEAKCQDAQLVDATAA